MIKFRSGERVIPALQTPTHDSEVKTAIFPFLFFTLISFCVTTIYQH
jgi:hypothetical protein